MQQKGKNSKKLANYCKKEKDVSLLNKSNVTFEELTQNDIFADIYENRFKLTIDEAKKIINENFPYAFASNYNNIMNWINDNICPSLPEFKWVLPTH